MDHSQVQFRCVHKDFFILILSMQTRYFFLRTLLSFLFTNVTRMAEDLPQPVNNVTMNWTSTELFPLFPNIPGSSSAAVPRQRTQGIPNPDCSTNVIQNVCFSPDTLWDLTCSTLFTGSGTW
mmetsp:Transcript_55355/g.82043  ORF Transcript_55355/g.82043 Transcript_55355/m.82043 type:complete len:122 (-) Transcript_55355:592-957(-)